MGEVWGFCRTAQFAACTASASGASGRFLPPAQSLRRAREKSVVPGQSPQKVEVERSTKCSGGPVHFYRVVGGGHNLRLQLPNASQWLVDFFRGSAAPASAAIAAPPATAATGDDQRICFSGAAGDANVAACGRLIASNALRGGDLVRAHMQRAVLLARRGDDYDRVIADASESSGSIPMTCTPICCAAAPISARAIPLARRRM